MSEEKETPADEPGQDGPRDWHRLLSGFLRDWLSNQTVAVQSEVDLSVQKQLLDVLIIRQDAASLSVEMPDGFEKLSKYNLITFKSHQESLTAKAMDELVSHFVTYRKIVSPREKDLPKKDFRLFALTVQFPQKLARREKLKEISKGVYQVRSFSKKIRIVVVHQLPLTERNALLHLFSAKKKALTFAREHYRVQSDRSSTLLSQLLGQYSKEGISMPFDIDQWIEEKHQELIRDAFLKLKPEDRIAGLKPEERVAGLKPEERVAGLKPEERVAGLSTEELLKALSPDTLDALLAMRHKQTAEKPTDPK